MLLAGLGSERLRLLYHRLKSEAKKCRLTDFDFDWKEWALQDLNL